MSFLDGAVVGSERSTRLPKSVHLRCAHSFGRSITFNTDGGSNRNCFKEIYRFYNQLDD